MGVQLRKLTALIKVIKEEAERNEEFAKALEGVLEENKPKNKRPKPKAILDPIACAGDGTLKEKLQPLSEQELKDIISVFRFRKSSQVKRATKADLTNIIVTEAYALVNHGKVFHQSKIEQK